MGLVEVALAKLKIEVTEARRGRLWARCPYHSPDNHPSWCIRITNERYGQHVCFSCKAGGSLVQLVRHVLDLPRAPQGDFLDEGPDPAREWLDALGKMPDDAPPEPMPEQVRLVQEVQRRAFRMPPEVIFDPLAEWVTPALTYALNRGLTGMQVRRWKIGYAVEGRLAGRIVMPTFHWRTGAPAGYTARTFVGDKVRYLHPAATEHPAMDVMFGEANWPEPADRKSAAVVVTEGALDALAVERALTSDKGLPYVAALGSSHYNPMHAGKLAGFEQVTVMTDADQAGDHIAAELIAALARHVLLLRRVRLRPGTDANSLAPEALRWEMGL